ncbi:hypothetical protein A0W34_28155 [Rhodococcus sp. BH4]|nr:hypothetical protein A0W34_28155 [Rhodococcus sp. BH4]
MAIAASLQVPAAHMPGRAAAARQDLQHRPMGDPWAQHSFESWANACQQPSDSVADSSGFAGQVVIETGEHAEFGAGVISGVDSAQGVRHRSGTVGADERVTGIGFGLAGIQIGYPARRQPRWVGHLMNAPAGHCDRPMRRWCWADRPRSRSVRAWHVGRTHP